MSKRRAFEQRIKALNNHDMKTIINIISNSLYVYNQILWQCPNFDLITIGLKMTVLTWGQLIL